MSQFKADYLNVILGQFQHFKERAEMGFQQLSEDDFHWKPNDHSNSVAIIIKHLSGNMHSRWVDFLTTDGEKAYRDRDSEFVSGNESKDYLMQIWENGWALLFRTIQNLNEEDLDRTIILRKQPICVLQAIQTEIAHLSYHLGQILYIGKQIKNETWTILSIPTKDANKEEV